MYRRIGAVEFEWDAAKNSENIRKHGISFHEAADAFRDERAALYFDAAHSDDEDRYFLIGMSEKLRILVVCHCYRRDAASVRIISARKATAHEKKEYERPHAG